MSLHLRMGRAAAAVALTGLSACASLTTPPYQPANANVLTLQSIGGCQARIGSFRTGTNTPARLENLQVRVHTLTSSVDGSFASYLAEALRRELATAGCLAPEAAAVIDGMLLENRLDANGINVGVTTVGASIRVVRDGRDAYERTLSVRHEWESSFVGAIAIPTAVANYAPAVQKLLAELFADPAFRAAIRRG